MSIKDDLIAAKAMIDTPEKWCKHTYGDKEDKQFCAYGAVSMSTVVKDRWSIESTNRKFACLDILNELVRPSPSIVDFNDLPNTTHADVMALFDRAIEAAK